MEESLVEIAISETGFGKFSIKVTIICYLIYLNAGLSTTSTGFILPAAACDFKMNTIDKGRFSSAFLIGGCISPIICGFLSNIKGRKWVLMVSLFLQGNSDLLQSFVSNYWAALFLKFISGIAVTGQIFTVITYISECIPLKQRKSLLSFMEFFWIAGHALASGMIIIPLSFAIRKEYFFFRSWNLYTLICSLPGILIGFWLTFFPETPKYLAEMGSSERLFQVLIDMYQQNFGKPGKEYIEKLRNSGNSSMMEMVNKNFEKLPDLSVKSDPHSKIVHELKHVISIFKRPFLKNTFFACVFAFLSSSSYFALFLWLPEIFQRFANFESQYNNESLNLCTVSRGEYSNNTNTQQSDPFGCNIPVDTSVFINNLVLCAACAPAIFPVTFLVNRFGFKFFLASHCLICSMVILGLYFVNSSLQNLILMCVYLSLISVCITCSFAFFVTIFPTNLRSSGVIVTSFSSRIGGVVGNLVFSYLIDHYCLSLIILIVLQLTASTVSTILIRE